MDTSNHSNSPLFRCPVTARNLDRLLCPLPCTCRKDREEYYWVQYRNTHLICIACHQPTEIPGRVCTLCEAELGVGG